MKNLKRSISLSLIPNSINLFRSNGFIKKYFPSDLNLFLLIFFCTAFGLQSMAQNDSEDNSYTQSLYTIDSYTDVVYGTATDYGDNEVSLTMDIFKPVGDENCKRPVILFLHGGAWAVGSKEDESMQFMAQEMAKKGWVTAAINYRLGTHNNPDYEMNLICNNSLSEPCAYVSDTAEAIRANYRAMQDAKAAVRFMKNRHLNDSTDIHNVFIAGESAGAFTSFLVAYLNDETEKPEACFDIEDAPLQSSYFDENPCVSEPSSLSRPDLGSVAGDLNIGSYDSSVRGVGSFFGAVFDMSIFEQNENSPCVYLFAQGSDVIVHYEYDKLFGRIDNECYNNFLCQNYENYPYCTGNEGVRKYFEANPQLGIDYSADIIDNYDLNGNCFESGHEIDQPELRLQNMTEFFADKVLESGNHPSTNCNTTHVTENNVINDIYITNNLTSTEFFIHHPGHNASQAEYLIITQFGQMVRRGTITDKRTSVDVSGLSSGIYLVNISNKISFKAHKLVIH